LKLADFQEALKEKIQRPFIFGPIEFSGLDQESFPGAEWRNEIVGNLSRSLYLPENLCIHGFNVTVKNKTLKRASTIVKHSRFLRNLIVSPVFPAPPKQVEAAPKDEEEEPAA